MTNVSSGFKGKKNLGLERKKQSKNKEGKPKFKCSMSPYHRVSFDYRKESKSSLDLGVVSK